MNLENKTCIVTGASRGIGKATAELLLSKGATVVGWGRTNPKINNSNFHFEEVDVTQTEEVASIYDITKSKYGFPAVIVNNSGLGYFKYLQKITEEEWDEMFAVNVKGIFNTCRVVVPDMIQQKTGHVINIASIAGLTGIVEGTAYCATKHAVRGFSESLYKEIKKFGVKVSCIYPGSVNTDFFDNYPRIESNNTMLNPKDIANAILHVLDTPDNVDTLNIEIRPLNPEYSV